MFSFSKVIVCVVSVFVHAGITTVYYYEVKGTAEKLVLKDLTLSEVFS